MKQCQKTCRTLYEEFCNKFTQDQVMADIELRAIYNYLTYRCSMSDGNYLHEPRETTRQLIIKHLYYDPKTEKPTPEGELISNNAGSNVHIQ